MWVRIKHFPQVACSNWKRVFLIFAGLADPDGSLRPSIDIFRQVKSMEDYSPSEQEYRLRYAIQQFAITLYNTSFNIGTISSSCS